MKADLIESVYSTAFSVILVFYVLVIWAAVFAACDLNIINQSDQNQDQNRNEADGGIPIDTTLRNPQSERAACNPTDGTCSAFRLLWQGGLPPFLMVCTGGVLVTPLEQTLNGSGVDLIDPGPPGNGPGTYSCEVNGVPFPPVTTDS
jgi:hypothetical protein